MIKITSSVGKNIQLRTFEIIRDILLANSTIASYFKSSDFYEFDPAVKAVDFDGYPYIVIKIPSVNDQLDYLGNITYENVFTVEIEMVNEYVARSKVSELGSAVLAALQGSADSLRLNAYELINIDLVTNPEPNIINQKDVILSTFELNLRGEVRI